MRNNAEGSCKSHPKTYFFLLVIVAGIITSCGVTKRNTDYFQNLKQDTTLNDVAPNNYQNIIQAGDKLAINASSLSPVEDGYFNQGGGEGGTTTSAAAFLVDDQGKVLLHRLGKVQAAGLTRKQLSAKLQDQLSPFMKDVIVSVNFVNHKITVLGAVKSPQVIPLTSEQMPVIDALVLSGELTATGKSDDIMIIREDGNKRQVKHINLRNTSFINSEWYYARPNDIIYVSNDYTAAEKAEKRQKLTNTLSLAASGVSFLIIILDRVIK